MKFQVREGFVCKTITKVDLGDGKFELQENTAYPGQTVDFNAEHAEQHAHKLEPKDKAAEAFLNAKVLPSAPGAALGLTPEALALVQETAKAMASQMLAALQAPAQAPTPAGS